ncbi:MAG TPA: DCC1-like thiol-disulfide oxidoreductase family protein [Verrucomicrobiae bacterium]
MRTRIRVASPPPKPLMVFDGDCNFCSFWIRRWRQLTGEAVDYTPSQDPAIPARFPEIPSGQFAASVILVERDGGVYSAAEAVFRVLTERPGWRWPLLAYRRFSWFAALAEWAYYLVARHRRFFSWLTRLLWRHQVEQPE